MFLAPPRRVAAVALVAVAVTACSDSTEPPLPAVALLEWQKPATLLIDDSTRLDVRALDAQGQPVAAAVTFASSDTAVLAVDGAGRVRARDFGEAWLRVAAGGVADSARVRVHWEEPAATELSPGTAWRDVAAGTMALSWCALAPDGRLRCSGSRAPVIAGGPALHDVSAGQDMACGLAADGGAHCFGGNGDGELGLGVTTPLRSDTLVAAASGRTWARLVVGDHKGVCGIQAADSVVYCWGHNDNGQVGRLPVSARELAVAPFATPLRAKALDLDSFTGCAVALDDALWCWGNPYGFAASPTTPTVPVQVAPAGSYVDVALGLFHTCALEADGSAWCWGSETAGATVAERFTPRRVATRARFSRIFAGYESPPCGLTADGALHCWSVAGSGADLFVARPRMPDRRFTSVTMGNVRAALATDGRIWAF